MDGPLGLWVEVIQDSTSVTDPVFLECLQSGESKRLFERIIDEDLKTILGVVNKLLNDPKSRLKGITVLEKLLKQVCTTRLIAFQDSLQSSLHMIIKDIDSAGTLSTLVEIIPICKQLTDVNQTISSSVIPKILSYICDDSNDAELSAEEISLLKICLELYHGPCGNYRTQLEKRLLSSIDHPNVNINDVVPLLSSAGGGGVKGDKHGLDWNMMLVKTLYAAYDTICGLYSDACPVLDQENPFESEHGKLNIPEIREQKVFLRISMLKKRLNNLSDLIGSYLGNPFPAPKPVPAKSILRYISNLLVLNPVDLLKKSQFSTPKEFYFLATVLPSIHEAGFKLLSNLITSVGSNLFPEAARVEQLIMQEFKWISSEHQSYEDLKIEIYRCALKWMKITRNSVTTTKVVATFVDFIKKDIKIEKEIVRLNVSVTGKSKHNKKKKSSTDFASNTIASTPVTNSLVKNAEVTSLALELLCCIIPCLDHTSYVKIYPLIAKTVIDVGHSGSFPSPYENPKCRSNLFDCVLALGLNPHPNVALSLSLLVNLARIGIDDPVTSVATISRQVMSTLERIIHPMRPSMDFISVPVTATSEVVQKSSSEIDDHDVLEVENLTEVFEASCQTETEISESFRPPRTETPTFSTPIANFDSTTLKKLIAEAIRENLAEMSTPHHQSYSNNVKEANDSIVKRLFSTATSTSPLPPSPLSSPARHSSKETISTNGNHYDEGEGKRKCDDDDQVHSDSEQSLLTTKRQKISEEDSPDVEEMALSLVDIGCM